MATAPSIVAYDPLVLRIDERFYTREDIDRIISAAGELPPGDIEIDDLNDTATGYVRKVVDRRNALAWRLELAAHNYVVSAEMQKKPSPVTSASSPRAAAERGPRADAIPRAGLPR